MKALRDPVATARGSDTPTKEHTELRGLEVSIVARDLPGEKSVLHLRPGANVVNNQVSLRRFVPDVSDDAHMIYSAAEIPRHHVARQKVFAAAGGCQRFAFAREKGLQIWNATMIDVCIRPPQSPLRRIRGEV